MFVSTRPHVQIAIKRDLKAAKARKIAKTVTNATLIATGIAGAYIALLAIAV